MKKKELKKRTKTCTTFVNHRDTVDFYETKVDE